MIGRNSDTVTCAPPVKDIIATVRHIIACQANGVLVIPKWPAASFWRFICSDGRHFNSMFQSQILAYLELKSGPQMKSKLFSGIPPFQMMVLYFNVSVIN